MSHRWNVKKFCGLNVRLIQIYKFTKYKPKFHLARHVSTWPDTFDVSSACILDASSLSNSIARQARHDELDTSNLLCCVETWRAKWNLGYMWLTLSFFVRLFRNNCLVNNFADCCMVCNFESAPAAKKIFNASRKTSTFIKNVYCHYLWRITRLCYQWPSL